MSALFTVRHCYARYLYINLVVQYVIHTKMILQLKIIHIVRFCVPVRDTQEYVTITVDRKQERSGGPVRDTQENFNMPVNRTHVRSGGT